MQLYKSRDFGSLFQDTFSFIRQNGGHLFKHFFIVNGIFILTLMVFGYFFSNFYTDIVFGSINNNNPNAIEQYMDNNGITVLLFVIAFMVIGLISIVFSYAYVPIYLKLYAKNNTKNFGTSDIINTYKTHIGAIIIFLLCTILIAFPVFFVAGITAFILAITIIGLLLVPLVLGAVSLFYQGALMEYLENKRGIWNSFGYSWQLISSKFWAAIGCVGLFYLMSYIVQNIIILIPYFIFLIDIVTGLESGGNTINNEEITQSAALMVVIIFTLSYFISLILNVIVQINQGIVFYSLKEDKENIGTKSEIDSIGSGD